jgi:signal recognition particle subunit SRP54
MGDVVSLVEKAAETIDHDKARKIAARMKKGTFDLEDMAEQLQQVVKMGGLGGIMGMMPGVAKMKKQMSEANLDNKIVSRQIAIISSMTRFEKANPKVMNASRKKRVASGSGTKVEEINKLLKMHLQMADMMKKLGRNPGLMGKMFGGGGGPSAAEMERMQAELSSMDPSKLPPEMRALMEQQGGKAPALPDMSKLAGGLPGLGAGRGLPGLGGNIFKGFPGLPGKKK